MYYNTFGRRPSILTSCSGVWAAGATELQASPGCRSWHTASNRNKTDLGRAVQMNIVDSEHCRRVE
jgi:hypothetical protein